MPHEAAAETRLVRQGESLQAAIDAARSGDVILLEAGAIFSGNFTLRDHGGTEHVTIRSATPEGQLPAEGVRITPAHAPLLARIQSPNTVSAIRVASGAHHWRLRLLELAANQLGAGEILRIGEGWSAQSLSRRSRTRLTSIGYTSTAIPCSDRSAGSPSTVAP